MIQHDPEALLVQSVEARLGTADLNLRQTRLKKLCNRQQANARTDHHTIIVRLGFKVFRVLEGKARYLVRSTYLSASK